MIERSLGDAGRVVVIPRRTCDLLAEGRLVPGGRARAGAGASMRVRARVRPSLAEGRQGPGPRLGLKGPRLGLKGPRLGLKGPRLGLKGWG